MRCCPATPRGSRVNTAHYLALIRQLAGVYPIQNYSISSSQSSFYCWADWADAQGAHEGRGRTRVGGAVQERRVLFIYLLQHQLTFRKL